MTRGHYQAAVFFRVDSASDKDVMKAGETFDVGYFLPCCENELPGKCLNSVRSSPLMEPLSINNSSNPCQCWIKSERSRLSLCLSDSLYTCPRKFQCKLGKAGNILKKLPPERRRTLTTWIVCKYFPEAISIQVLACWELISWEIFPY